MAQFFILRTYRQALGFAVGILCLCGTPAHSFATRSAWVAVPSSSLFRPSPARHSPSLRLHATQPSQKSPAVEMVETDDVADAAETSSTATTTSPLDRPLLAMVDAVALLAFAAVGKASHGTGSTDLLDTITSVGQTALPFGAAWFATAPLTGVYENNRPTSDSDNNNLLVATVQQVARGWAVAIPLGIVGRGLLKGYVPPLSFAIVTLVATLVFLTLARVVFAVVEDFFVEMVN